MKQKYISLVKTCMFLLTLIVPIFSFGQVSPYCMPSNDSNGGASKLHISELRIEEFSSGSEIFEHIQPSPGYSSTGYSDHYGVSAPELQAGQKYTIKLRIKIKDDDYDIDGERIYYQSNLVFWLDYNNNDIFDFPYERIGLLDDSSDEYREIDFTLPEDLPTMNTGLRINMGNYYSDFQYPCSLKDIGELEDYQIQILGSPTPFAKNDKLFVAENSGAGTANQVDVSVNDFIGRANGGDSDNYSLISGPSTANGSVVTEVTDGVFQYVPALDFIGDDSFSYQICDNNNVCDTATVNVHVSKIQSNCVPISVSDIDGKVRYITNVNFSGETGTINNTSGDDGGYANYTNLPAVDVYLGDTYPLEIKIHRGVTEGDIDSGWAAYIDFNQDGNFDYSELVYNPNGVEMYPFVPQNITVPEDAALGETVMRIGTRMYYSATTSCGNTGKKAEEFEDYRINIKKKPLDLKVTGNNNLILDGATTTALLNHTRFDALDFEAPATTRVYAITNNGTPFNFGSNPITFETGTSANFSIVSQPANTTVATGQTVTFEVSFNPSDVGVCGETVVITGDNPKNKTFTFKIEGEGNIHSASVYFDGVDDYMETESIITGTPAGESDWNEATIMAWMKLEYDGSIGDNLDNNVFIAGQRAIKLYISKNKTVRFRVHTQDLEETGPSDLKLKVKSSSDTDKKIKNNVWYHVAGVFNASTSSLKLYINGQEVDETTSPYLNSGILTNNSDGTPHDYTDGFVVGKYPTRTSHMNRFFKGNIDEVRVLKKALTDAQIKQMVHQEIQDNVGFVRGTVIPMDIEDFETADTVDWAAVKGYYPMTDIKSNTAADASGNGNHLTLHNITTIEKQTAPMPYETRTDGNWTAESTWLHGSVWDITTKANNLSDAAIVYVKHNLNVSENQSMIGLLVDADKEFSIKNDVGLYNSWYLKLDGFIDLEGESQLLQTTNSKLRVTNSGKIERDQQGTVNLFRYNYWSSPVHTSENNSFVNGNETYIIKDVLKDGTDAASPQDIMLVGGHNGGTSPMTIAKRWLYKFENLTSDSYADWQAIGINEKLKVGIGYTMKGTSTGPESDFQNYVFSGKPNNGEIKLELFAGNDYLVGNPYPSALDAYQFILDNENVISGTLYFWEHYGGGSHILGEYEGGYGLYNLSGSTPPLVGTGTEAEPDDDVSPNGTALKTPKRYIPVAQGFFVVAQDGGNVTFNNNQRQFVKEGPGNENSWFFRSGSQIHAEETLEDTRPKFRIGYKSPNNYKRQLLLTVDENASLAIDWGFDGELNEVNAEDMFWKIENRNYLIQGIDATLNTTVLPLSVKSNQGGMIEIAIDSLEHVSADTEIYLKDGDTYHDLRVSKYITTVQAGEINNRFDLVFEDPYTLSTNDDVLENDLLLYFDSSIQSLVIANSKNTFIKNVGIYNMLGQKIDTKQLDSNASRITLPVFLQTGIYLFELESENVKTNKKVLVH